MYILTHNNVTIQLVIFTVPTHLNVPSQEEVHDTLPTRNSAFFHEQHFLVVKFTIANVKYSAVGVK